jgi:hypothetical protein
MRGGGWLPVTLRSQHTNFVEKLADMAFIKSCNNCMQWLYCWTQSAEVVKPLQQNIIIPTVIMWNLRCCVVQLEALNILKEYQ